MISDIALIITALGVLFVLVGLRQSYRERLRQFEAMYIERYWKILDQLSLNAVQGTGPASINAEDERAIRSYILLCEDELQMRSNGYISDSTYAVWAEGMRCQLRQPMFRTIWQRVKQEAEDQQNFPYENLRSLEREDDSHGADPLSMRHWQRRLRGLAGPRGC